jgi:hypothetical protein
MIKGAITNSWRTHLQNHDLIALAKEAEARGARHIELRQTCLGNCETGEGDSWRPVYDNFQALVDALPSMSFNLAMALPCLTATIDPKGELFQSALKTAKLVNPTNPHLRVVDPAQFDGAWKTPADIPATAMGLVELTREAATQGVTLSIENSGQPISSLEMLVREVRSKLPGDAGIRFGLCPDPTNQLRRFPGTDPVADMQALPLDMIKIVHFKQTSKGEALPTVTDGDVDSSLVMKSLEGKGYKGALVMEIPPHPDVFENLSASYVYLGLN